MRNLLDTHTLIWFLNGEADLSDKVRKAIQRQGNRTKIFNRVSSV